MVTVYIHQMLVQGRRLSRLLTCWLTPSVIDMVMVVTVRDGVGCESYTRSRPSLRSSMLSAK